MMTLSRNQSRPFSLASRLTAVGLRRVSIGPPISVMVAGREAVALRLHQRHRGQHRHGRLAHRHHMRVRAEFVEHVDDVVDVVVEVEAASPTGTMRASVQSVM